jgi:hypothetical protein
LKLRNGAGLQKNSRSHGIWNGYEITTRFFSIKQKGVPHTKDDVDDEM